MVGARCRLRARAARSSPRSSPTSGSRCRSSLAFVITGSASMLAESIHSVADTGNQGLLFLGGKRSRKQPTAEHPFGFGTERYFWAFIVALVLFTLGSLFALYEGVEKLIDPHELESPVWAFGVLGVAMVLEGLSLRTAHAEADPSRAGPFVVALHPHHQEPRAARRAARGHRRPHRPALRADRHQPRRDHRQPALGRAGQHRHRTAARRDRGDPRRSR